MYSDDDSGQATAFETTPNRERLTSSPRFAPYSFSKLSLRDRSVSLISYESTDDEKIRKTSGRSEKCKKKKAGRNISRKATRSNSSSSDFALIERNDSEIVLEIIDDFIRGRIVPGITQSEISLVQKAVLKISAGIESAKKTLVTRSDLRKMTNMSIHSGSDEVFEIDRIPVISLSSDSDPEDVKDVDFIGNRIQEETNMATSDFEERLSKEKSFLRMEKIKTPVKTESIDLRYPLGVTYDGATNNWYVTESTTHTVIKIHAEFDPKQRNITEIKHRKIRNPTAICVLDEGYRLAVLCSSDERTPSICFIDIDTDEVTAFRSWYDKELKFCHATRGLARSLGTNLLTMDRPFNGTPRLCIFSTGTFQKKTFELPNADLPSFIATSGSTVVITDLGLRQTILQCKLDDTNFGNIDFQILREISTAGVNLSSSEMLNKKYFVYVSGAQIDRHGNIIVADAKNHHFKFFDSNLKLKHRISTDFPVPYVSSFHVNEYGEILILSTRDHNKMLFARLTSSDRLEKHIPMISGPRIAQKSLLSAPIRRF